MAGCPAVGNEAMPSNRPKVIATLIWISLLLVVRQESLLEFACASAVPLPLEPVLFYGLPQAGSVNGDIQ